MTIETKYNIGDEAWIYKDYKKDIIQGQVQDLRATSVFLDSTPTIEYTTPQKNSKRIVVQPLQWLPIDRDENGYATEECLDRIFNNLPCVVCSQTEVGYKYYNMAGEYFDMNHNREDLRTNTGYTHYLSIPKLEV